MNTTYETYIKQSKIANILTLADKIRGKESVSNLMQYRYDNLMKQSLSELEQILEGHIRAYNDMLKSQGKVDGLLTF